MKKDNNESLKTGSKLFLDEFYRYLSFWPYFIIAMILSLGASFLYLRYSTFLYESSAKIEIIDKANDSDMALPTSMTIFNRSMINLDNEIGVLSSHTLNEKVVSSLNHNIEFYTSGNLKSTQNHKDDWFLDYDFSLKDDVDISKIKKSFEIFFEQNFMFIDVFNSSGDLKDSYKFSNYTTINTSHDLPFELTLNNNNIDIDSKKIIKFFPVESVIKKALLNTTIIPAGSSSDQLIIKFRHSNSKIANDFINTLIYEFDNDGINDRQLEHKRTIDFTKTRSDFLTVELNKIELKRQLFKETNSLTDIKSDATLQVNQKYIYGSELFESKSQKDLLTMFQSLIEFNKYELLPINIGIENSSINMSIAEYNNLISERNKFLNAGAGLNNSFIVNLTNQIDKVHYNITNSVLNYEKSLDVTIENLKAKEDEFTSAYKNIPENEKILRSIERELEIKESLFLLLLQKREEAAINFAVVKPSIKIIDSARISTSKSVFPNTKNTYLLGLILGFLVPFSFLFLRFYFDNKIHTKQNLKSFLPELPIIGEIPFIDDNSILSASINESRSPIAESVRMILANLKFTNIDNENLNKTFLVTSSVKGEGKTLCSVNLASLLAGKGKSVLLVGADLRNPQIHKLFNLNKNDFLGLSDYLYKKNDSYEDYIIQKNNIDIMLSGSIPPNPTQQLASDKFKKFINKMKSIYDYIVIDSAPCLLVSDTFEISNYIDSTIYMVRANFTEYKLMEFITDCHVQKKLPNINIVLNSVGQSNSYGYKYGYQYGYQYGYKYSYNYGYGYGYSADK
tara:strand:- start:1728 stop:4109 length:2382 start_codon:yes stop_codon:yes gene_type:complete